MCVCVYLYETSRFDCLVFPFFSFFEAAIVDVRTRVNPSSHSISAPFVSSSSSGSSSSAGFLLIRLFIFISQDALDGKQTKTKIKL